MYQHVSCLLQEGSPSRYNILTSVYRAKRGLVPHLTFLVLNSHQELKERFGEQDRLIYYFVREREKRMEESTAKKKTQRSGGAEKLAR